MAALPPFTSPTPTTHATTWPRGRNRQLNWALPRTAGTQVRIPASHGRAWTTAGDNQRRDPVGEDQVPVDPAATAAGRGHT